MIPTAVVLGVLAVAVAWFSLIRFARDKSMRSLAASLGFEYMGRDLPDSFPSNAEPFDKIELKWNILQGTRAQTEIIVFDGVFGKGKGVYRTYIAVHSAKDPFPKDQSALGNVVQSAGWTAVFGSQPALNLVPWSLSPQRIEELVSQLEL